MSSTRSRRVFGRQKCATSSVDLGLNVAANVTIAFTARRPMLVDGDHELTQHNAALVASPMKVGKLVSQAKKVD